LKPGLRVWRPLRAEFDPDGPVGVVELGLFGRREIPAAHDIEVRRDGVDDGVPFALEVEPGRRPDLPIAAQQPLAFERRQRKQRAEIFWLDLQQDRVVEDWCWDEGHADRPRRLDAGRNVLRPRQVLRQVPRYRANQAPLVEGKTIDTDTSARL
jgi:hypothetical protein